MNWVLNLYVTLKSDEQVDDIAASRQSKFRATGKPQTNISQVLACRAE